MDYMRYHRYIILLEGENREFALREDACKGHLKIETGNNKGALRCQVENLKPMQKNEYVYKLIFFGTKRERTIYAVIGSLNTNRNGGSETYFRFNPTDVDGEGHSYDDFSSIIVAAASLTNEKEPLHPVLSGETGNQSGGGDDWESEGQNMVFFQEDETELYNESQADLSSELEEAAEELGMGHLMENGEKKEPGEMTCWDRPASQGRKTYNYFYNRQLRRSCEHMCQIVGYYEEISPFETDHLNGKWRKIQNVQSIPILSPGASYFAGRYKHYLFGAKEGPDGRATLYYIAIPGRFSEQERPDNGESGFTYWQSIRGAKDETGAYGYWIAAIDPMTGDIIDAE